MKNRTVCHRMKQPMRSHTSHKPNGRHTGFLLLKPAMAFQPDVPFLLTSLCLSPVQTSSGIFFQGLLFDERSPVSLQNCKLLHARFGVPLGSFQRVKSLSKNCKLLFKTPQLLD